MSDITVNISEDIFESKIVEEIIEVHLEGVVVTNYISSRITQIASHTMSGHRFVAVNSDGNIVYASIDDVATKNVVGMTLHAASENESLIIQTQGAITHSGWSFVVGNVYLTTHGNITQSVNNDAEFMCKVGTALSEHTLLINIEESIIYG